MITRVFKFLAIFGAVLLAPVASAAAQGQVCAQLERELARLTSLQGSGRGGQASEYADAANRQQQNIGLMKRQMTRGGCAPDVFIAIRQGGQCAAMAQRLAAMEDNLDTLERRLSRMQGRDYSGHIRGIQMELRRYRCGEAAETTRVRTAPDFNRYPNDVTRDQRYPNDVTRQNDRRQAPRGPGIFNNFWGNDRLSREQIEAIERAKRQYDGGGSGTVRTICVRTCDGFYFPISFSTVRSNLEEDASKCQAQCPGTEAKLFYHSNPGQDPELATAIDGTRYMELPNASRYQREFVNGCSCQTPEMMAKYENMSPRSDQPVELTLEQKLAALNNAPLPPRRGEAAERELAAVVKEGAEKKVRVVLSYPPMEEKSWDAQLAAGAPRPIPDREPSL